MMQELSTRGNLVFTFSTPLSYGVLKEADNFPYITLRSRVVQAAQYVPISDNLVQQRKYE